MSVTWTTSPGDMMSTLVDTWQARLHAAIVIACQRRAPEIENWMKENAPWQDRTGNARQTLNTQVIPALGQVLVLLAHGMDYGIYLEQANAGRYAIVAPAIDHWAQILLADIQELLR